MSASQNICLACGLCCDGTLIGFVELNREEIPAIKKIKHVEEANGDGFFLQPCDQFCDGCTIYEDRPKHCASFKCGLLQSVEQNEIAFETAVTSVQKVEQLKTAIEKKIAQLQIKLESRSFYFQMSELKRWLLEKEKNQQLNSNHLELREKVQILDQLVENEFGLSKF